MKKMKIVALLLLLMLLAGCNQTSTNMGDTTIDPLPANIILKLNDTEVYHTESVVIGSVYDLPMEKTSEETIYVGWTDGEAVYSGSIIVTEDITLQLVEENLADVLEFDTSSSNQTSLTIVGYTGSAKYLKIPADYNGLPIETVASNAFENSDVVEVYLHNNITSIETDTFLNTLKLEKVTFYGDIQGVYTSTVPDSTYEGIISDNNDVCTVTQTLEDGTIVYAEGCPIITAKMGDEVTIGGLTYTSYEITQDINDHLDEYAQILHEAAFSNCPLLETVVLPIGDVTFDGAFKNTPYLENILTTSEFNYTVLDGIVYSKDMHTLVYYASGLQAANVTIRSEVETISNLAFYGNSYIETMNIPAETEMIYSSAFNDMPSLTAIMVNSENDDYYSNSGILYQNVGNTVAIHKYPENKSDTNFVMTDDVEYISDYCFAYNQNLESITLSNTLQVIGDFAFAYTEKLTTIDLPSTVTIIEYNVLEGSVVDTLIIRNIAANASEVIILFSLYEDVDPNNLQVTIYIPDDALVLYENDSMWQYYSNAFELLSIYQNS